MWWQCIANTCRIREVGHPGADNYKVKGNLHWVSVAEGVEAEVRMYDRLFAHPAPGSRREGMRRSSNATSSTTSIPIR